MIASKQADGGTKIAALREWCVIHAMLMLLSEIDQVMPIHQKSLPMSLGVGVAARLEFIIRGFQL